MIDFFCISLKNTRYTVAEPKPRTPMISQLFTLFTFLWYFLAACIILYIIVDSPKELLFALIGGIAVALGIALKDIAASIISGFILLFEKPFQVGDRVTFDGHYGEIVHIGLKSVRLNTLSDDLITIPNSSFITQVVSTANAGSLEMMVVCHFYLDLHADIELARSLVHEIIVSSRYSYLNKPINFSISEGLIGDRLSLVLTSKSYVIDVKYEKHLQSDIYTRTNRMFNEFGINRPQFNYIITPSSDILTK